MLRISRLTDYGTLALTTIAGEPERIHTAANLAARLGLGAPTVAKVLKQLARSELVRGVRGQRGGYALARAPERITIADIVDALEEHPFGLTECSARSGSCELEPDCRVRASWLRINAVVRGALSGVTLAELVAPARAAPARVVRLPVRRRPEG